MVTADLTRIEVNWYLHHSTRGQNIWLKVHLQVRGLPELALDTGEGGRVDFTLFFTFLCARNTFNLTST